ncbi:MAG: hypothetical protein JWN56_1415 [Sphingobacteriales bacterium]|nr:hypothetical protein [Sphingobacteriales bacterium]
MLSKNLLKPVNNFPSLFLNENSEIDYSDWEAEQ